MQLQIANIPFNELDKLSQRYNIPIGQVMQNYVSLESTINAQNIGEQVATTGSLNTKVPKDIQDVVISTLKTQYLTTEKKVNEQLVDFSYTHDIPLQETLSNFNKIRIGLKNTITANSQPIAPDSNETLNTLVFNELEKHYSGQSENKSRYL